MTDPSLFELFDTKGDRVIAVEVDGLARFGDPATSKEAASRVDAKAIEAAILAEFSRFGWLTDDELAGNLDHLCAASVKTARSRLKNAGQLTDSGSRRPSNHGRRMIVWCLRG